MHGPLTIHLQQILGPDGFIAFVQAMGGTSVYIAYRMRDDNDVVEVLGREVADKLSRALAPCYIRVPLARRERALYYRAQGLSNARIARLLGVTESGVSKLWAREIGLPDRPGRGKENSQLTLI